VEAKWANPGDAHGPILREYRQNSSYEASGRVKEWYAEFSASFRDYQGPLAPIRIWSSGNPLTILPVDRIDAAEKRFA
jgi:hypothetical protein